MTIEYYVGYAMHGKARNVVLQ